MTYHSSYLIYKITNTANGKVYIGETCRSLNERFCQHCAETSCCTKLKRAIKKYGKESFVIEQIDHAHSKEEAFNKEEFWIKHYDSVNKGYNILHNRYSSANKPCKRVYCYETKQIFNSAGECARFFGITSSSIIGCCSGRRSMTHNKHFCFVDDCGIPQTQTIKWSRPNHTQIICVETGRVFDTVRSAAKWLGKSEMCIFKCLKGESIRTGGYHWEYANPEYYPPKINKKRHFHKTLCVETGTVFETAKEAADWAGVHLNSILQCCHGKSKTSGGLHWKFVK